MVLLEPGERAASLPDDTARTPLEARVHGFLERDANVGEAAAVTTVLGRRVEGTLVRVQPAPGHSFGRPVPELLAIGSELRARLRGSDGADV
jgi:2-amino-4-ketopentanoate thiolase alpha subunit